MFENSLQHITQCVYSVVTLPNQSALVFARKPRGTGAAVSANGALVSALLADPGAATATGALVSIGTGMAVSTFVGIGGASASCRTAVVAFPNQSPLVFAGKPLGTTAAVCANGALGSAIHAEIGTTTAASALSRVRAGKTIGRFVGVISVAFVESCCKAAVTN